MPAHDDTKQFTLGITLDTTGKNFVRQLSN